MWLYFFRRAKTYCPYKKDRTDSFSYFADTKKTPESSKYINKEQKKPISLFKGIPEHSDSHDRFKRMQNTHIKLI
ncbi:hypothetical protein CE655_11660 [Salmonella enterica]|nr:hypothetical protein [Salmonella enterica]